MKSRSAFLATWILLPLSALALDARPFDFSADTLCFENSDPDLAKADPILGKLGVKKGVCQGIAGLSAAFYEHVVFDPTAPKELDGERKVESFIRDLRTRYRFGPSDSKVRVGGYADLKSFCADYRMVFLRQSARFNAEIAISDILPVYPSFLAHKSKSIKSSRDQDRLARFIRSVNKTLEEGRLPLILVYSHVVAVLSSQTRTGATDLLVYDSNHKAPRTWTIALDPDGRPSLGNRMHWEITPGLAR